MHVMFLFMLGVLFVSAQRLVLPDLLHDTQPTWSSQLVIAAH